MQNYVDFMGISGRAPGGSGASGSTGTGVAPPPILCVRKVVSTTNLALVYTPMWGGHTPIEGWFQGEFQGGSRVVPGGSRWFQPISQAVGTGAHAILRGFH